MKTVHDHLKEILGKNPRWIVNNKETLAIEVGSDFMFEAEQLNHNYDGIPIHVNTGLQPSMIRLIKIIEYRYVIL